MNQVKSGNILIIDNPLAADHGMIAANFCGLKINSEVVAFFLNFLKKVNYKYKIKQ